MTRRARAPALGTAPARVAPRLAAGASGSVARVRSSASSGDDAAQGEGLAGSVPEQGAGQGEQVGDLACASKARCAEGARVQGAASASGVTAG